VEETVLKGIINRIIEVGKSYGMEIIIETLM
jgi:hypothetical protein